MWPYAWWGLIGGLAVEGAAILRAGNDSSMPWRRFGRGVYLLRVVIRMALGACVAAGLGSSHEISNVVMAFLSGAGAPLFLEKALQITRAGSREENRLHLSPSRDSPETVIVAINDNPIGTGSADGR